MLIIDSKLQAKYKIAPTVDDGKPITFRFHFPRDTFGKSLRLSTLELKDFVIQHLVGVICCGLLSEHPRAMQEFAIFYQFMVSYPDSELDKLHNWIWVEQRDDRKGYVRVPVEDAADDAVICLKLDGHNPHPIHRPSSLVLENIG